MKYITQILIVYLELFRRNFIFLKSLENRLATVATNGVVVTWDLNKPSRSKLDTVFKDHERPVNKVKLTSFTNL